MKKRIRNHTNPLNIRQRLDNIDIASGLNTFSVVNLEIGFGKGVLCSNLLRRIQMS